MHLTGREHRLHRHAAGGILPEQVVEDGVADLVGHLVRMTLGDRLGRE